MSYRCGICNDTAPHGQVQHRHVIEREVEYKPPTRYQAYTRNPCEREINLPLPKTRSTRTEIAREIPVCHGCKRKLEVHSLAELVRWLRQEAKMELKRLVASATTSTGETEHPKEESRDTGNRPPPKQRKQSKPHPRRQDREGSKPVCDVCGRDASDGQITSSAVLCRKHMGN